MAKSKKIIVQGREISIILNNEEEYISLTDMAKFKDREATGIVIANWLSTKYTIQFMGAWEQVHNPRFNVMEFNNIKTWVMYLLPRRHKLDCVFRGQPICDYDSRYLRIPILRHIAKYRDAERDVNEACG